MASTTSIPRSRSLDVLPNASAGRPPRCRNFPPSSRDRTLKAQVVPPARVGETPFPVSGTTRSSSVTRGIGKRKQRHNDAREFGDATDEMLDVICQMERLRINTQAPPHGESGDASPVSHSHESERSDFHPEGAPPPAQQSIDSPSPAPNKRHPHPRSPSKSSSKSPKHSNTLSRTSHPPRARINETPKSPSVASPTQVPSMSPSERDLVRCYVIVDHLMALKETSEGLSTACYGQAPNPSSSECYRFEQDTNLKVWDPECVLDKMRKVLGHLEDAHTEWNLMPISMQTMYNVIATQLTALKERIVETFRNILNEMRGMKRRRRSATVTVSASASASAIPNVKTNVIEESRAPPAQDHRARTRIAHTRRASVNQNDGRKVRSSAGERGSRSTSRSASRERQRLADYGSISPSTSTTFARKNSFADVPDPGNDSSTGGRRPRSLTPRRSSAGGAVVARKSSLSSSAREHVRKLSSSSVDLDSHSRENDPKSRRNSTTPVLTSAIPPVTAPLTRIREEPAHATEDELYDVDDHDFVDQACIVFQ